MAKQAAHQIIALGLAACANSLPGMSSVYRWQGKIETTTETVVLFKTTAQRAAALKAAILAQHTYDTPCILAIAVDPNHSHAPYLQWLHDETNR